jgi:hypothetical protein
MLATDPLLMFAIAFLSTLNQESSDCLEKQLSAAEEFRLAMVDSQEAIARSRAVCKQLRASLKNDKAIKVSSGGRR